MAPALVDPFSSPDPGLPAAKLSEAYHLDLTQSWKDWFGRNLHGAVGSGEFSRAVDGNSLVEHPGDAVWPGLMPPDFLPLVSNGAGDWLCARVDARNQLSDVVHWYHGGGDWIPWGNSLAEALIFDAIWHLLPGPHRRHAIAAEEPRRGDPQIDPWIVWALEQIPSSLAETVRNAFAKNPSGPTIDGMALAEEMVEHHVAEVAVRCELIQAAKGDWSCILQHAEQVTHLAPELAWPWEWAAQAHQHLGNRDQAESAYITAALCSSFTDQAVRLRTEFDESSSPKFSLAMLKKLHEVHGSEGLPPGLDHPDYVEMLLQSKIGLAVARQNVHRYWMDRADQQDRDGQHGEALESLMMAGWDLGVQPMSVYRGLLERIADTAHRAGQPARSALARMHADCFQTRYG